MQNDTGNTAAKRLRALRKALPSRLRRTLALFVALAFTIVPGAPMFFAAPVAAAPAPPAPSPAGDGCMLNSARGEIQHVIHIQFDNVHFRRDNPNVPSDLEQMPNLLDFLTDNGVLMTNHHTPLISHTADDIITGITGVYGDRHGISVANSFGFFNPPGSQSFDSFRSGFQYWTDKVGGSDPTFFMITADGKNAPAPWVPFTRAGCDVGAVSTANIELENVSGDIKTVFASDPTVRDAALKEAHDHFDMAVADFEGIAIHCAAGSALCSGANHGQPDVLPDEPGSYNGFNALYGHKFVAPVISPGGPLKDLDGNTITDGSTPANVGFPGFGEISAAQSLAYVAVMQEHGIPVTYAYISDVHDNHSADNPYGPAECLTDPEQGALGPGDACYVAQLKAYDRAFGTFFKRLEKDGINKSNTLFVITSDENDHFAGGPPSPATCDGINVTCSYDKLGEIDSNITSLLHKEDPATSATPFDIHFDMAPTFYIKGNPPAGDPVAREFERDAAKLMVVSPITNAVDTLTVALADPVEMKLLHMVTGDPQRTPTFVMFGNADYFFLTFGPDAQENSGFAWNHGGVQPEIVRTWLGLVGPGVKNRGIDNHTWSDHTDIRPTMLALAGLVDDYQHQGRVLAEELHHWALPDGVEDSRGEFVELARAYKRINAPNGELARGTLRISTRALASGNAMDDSMYTQLEGKLANITALRDTLAAAMLSRLEDATFHGKRISEKDARVLINQADALLDMVRDLDENDD